MIMDRIEGKLILDELELAGASWVTVAKLRDGAGWHLSWHDGVANAWEFEDPRLSVVLLRLASLVACGEVDFTAYFTADDVEFAAAARQFLTEQTASEDATWHGGPAKPTITRHSVGCLDGEWRLWIPPTSTWCYEGGRLHGAIHAPWGDTYHPTHAAACQFLGEAILAGKVG